MNFNPILNIGLILFFTILSGIFDSQGFIHASKIWKDGHIVYRELLFSAFGFGLGIPAYWVTLKFLQNFGNVSTEAQALGWFITTMVGVAIINKSFLGWSLLDQVIGFSLLAGVAWLIVRTGG
jgi:hypothetical protein